MDKIYGLIHMQGRVDAREEMLRNLKELNTHKPESPSGDEQSE